MFVNVSVLVLYLSKNGTTYHKQYLNTKNDIFIIMKIDIVVFCHSDCSFRVVIKQQKQIYTVFESLRMINHSVLNQHILIILI